MNNRNPIENYQQVMYNPEAFDSYMRSIDEQLKAAGVDIEGRVLVALPEISRELNCIISSESELASQINRWFQDRYDNR